MERNINLINSSGAMCYVYFTLRAIFKKNCVLIPGLHGLSPNQVE